MRRSCLLPIVLLALAAAASPASAAFDAPAKLVSAGDYPKDYGAQIAALDVAADGDAVAFWQSARRTPRRSTDMRVSRYDAHAGRWSAELRLDAPHTRLVNQEPVVALDPEGNAFAVWARIVESTDQATALSALVAKRFDARTRTWSRAARLSVIHGVAARPALAVDGAGNALVVWHQFLPDGPMKKRHTDNAFVVLHAKRYDAASGRWDAAPTVLSEQRRNDAGRFSGDPRVHFDGHGDAIALWAEAIGERDVIHARRFDAASGSWSETTSLSDASGSAFSADLAVTPSGDAVAVWGQAITGRGQIIRAKRFHAASATWDASAVDVSGVAPVARFTRVTADAAGNATAIWNQLPVAGARQQVMTARLDAGAGAWKAPRQLSTSGAKSVRPQIASDAAGNTIAAWTDLGDDKLTHVRANRYDAATGAWLPAGVLMTPHESSTPLVAVDTAGAGMVSWFQGNARGGRDLAARPF